MFCSTCGVKLSEQAKFCSACGMRIQSDHGAGSESRPATHTSSQDRSVGQPPEAATTVIKPVTPAVNEEFRTKLLNFFLAELPSEELSRWLQDLKQDSRGSIAEKIARIREHTRYLTTPVVEFPEQTLNHLRVLNRVEILVDLCRELGLSDQGSKSVLFRRIYREVGYCEGWLTPIDVRSPVFETATVLPFVQWYPILSWPDYEREYYDDFHDEMVDVFGTEYVHDQVVVAHGNALKIDFHIGPVQEDGVGVEFKLPANNPEVQRAGGQIDQYLRRYRANLIVVLIPHLLKSTDVSLLRESLRGKSVELVIKSDRNVPLVDRQAA